MYLTFFWVGEAYWFRHKSVDGAVFHEVNVLIFKQDLILKRNNFKQVYQYCTHVNSVLNSSFSIFNSRSVWKWRW